MRTVKLTKEVNRTGNIEIELDGKALDYKLSRELTGTTDEYREGIFSDNAEGVFFDFGSFSTRIAFAGYFDPARPVADIAEIIKTRAAQVQKWVRECQQTAGEVDFKI